MPNAPDWQVLHTPGHTDCSTSLYNARTRTLFSGNAVLTLARALSHRERPKGWSIWTCRARRRRR